jgi:ribosomal protein S18 acetylase RimI-like enzyme
VGIRQAVEGDEHELRSIRLRALADAPDAFASTSEREAARTTADWRRWLAPGATFFFDDADGRPVGLVAAVGDADDAGLRHLMACWVDPAARGTGVGDALVESMLSWASRDGADRARVEVYADNTTAIGLYERHGFRRTGASRAPDDRGRVAVDLERGV